MLVHRTGAAGGGVGAALLGAAERSGLDAGKTLLVLDTASDDAGTTVRPQGWGTVRQIPNYALLPTHAVRDDLFLQVAARLSQSTHAFAAGSSAPARAPRRP